MTFSLERKVLSLSQQNPVHKCPEDFRRITLRWRQVAFFEFFDLKRANVARLLGDVLNGANSADSFG